MIITERLNARVVECHFGGKGGKVNYDEPIEYNNSTGIMCGNIRSKLLKGNLFLVEDDGLISQFTNRRYFINSDGSISLEKKEAMKKRVVHSSDRADSLGLALNEPRNSVVMEILQLSRKKE